MDVAGQVVRESESFVVEGVVTPTHGDRPLLWPTRSPDPLSVPSTPSTLSFDQEGTV